MLFPGQKIKVKGDRGFGEHEVEVISRQPKLEAFYKEISDEQDIFKVKDAEGNITFIYSMKGTNEWGIDPFIQDDINDNPDLES